MFKQLIKTQTPFLSKEIQLKEEESNRNMKRAGKIGVPSAHCSVWNTSQRSSRPNPGCLALSSSQG